MTEATRRRKILKEAGFSTYPSQFRHNRFISSALIAAHGKEREDVEWDILTGLMIKYAQKAPKVTA